MKNIRLVVASAVAAILLAGRGGMELQDARTLAPPGGAFDKTLFTGYLTLSKSEYAEGDYRDSDKFAIRASRTAEGGIIAP